MFFSVELDHLIELEPRHFGPSLEKRLRSQLELDVEGVFDRQHGFIIAIKDNPEPKFGKGRIHAGRGEVTFRVKYTALVMMPFRGEVILGFVMKINKNGIFAESGPIKVYVSQHEIPKDFEFDLETGTFRSLESGETIAKDTELRIQITGVSGDGGQELVVTGTIRREELGIFNS